MEAKCISDSVWKMVSSTWEESSHYTDKKTKALQVSESDFAKATKLEHRRFWVSESKVCTLFITASLFLEIKNQNASSSETYTTTFI